MAKSEKDKMKDALGLKSDPEDSSNEEEAIEVDDELEEETSEEEIPEVVSSPHKKPTKASNTIPQTIPLKSAKKQEPKDLKIKQPDIQVPKPQQQPQVQDVWLNWLDANMVLTAADVSVYKRADGGRVVVFLDPTGRKPILNCGVHLTKDVIDKISADTV